ncbi:MAG: sigma-54-dependent Fis family transcriptional regulator [Acidobacteria bacterium]|nr:sigma-54-dependent Fis family transcriptional regulator [Acidobacteriota bacterium]
MSEDRRPRLLVVDDEPGILALVQRFAAAEDFEVVTRTGGHALLTELPALKPDVALVDRNMPEVAGLDVLRMIREVDPDCSVILMTAYATVDSAIEAVKLGALDYLSKPLDFDRLRELLNTVRHGIERRRRLLAVDSDLASRFEFCGMVGRSPVMQDLFDMIRRLAPHARTALISGETGTGKELVARALHRLGPRRDRKFIAFNCSAVVETLFESELFGHTRGAFTGAMEAKAGLFELADGGTLFLDEVGELPQSVQAKLLRVIEYGEVQRVGAAEGRRVDVRIIAATNRQLFDEVVAGRFRQDLYYRLNVIEIGLPSLRERPEDIPYLTAAFIKEFAARFGKALVGVSPGAERLLHNAPWPGNVRELRNVIERACMLSDGRILSERDVLSVLGAVAPCPAPAPRPAAPASTDKAREVEAALDRRLVEQVLQQVGGNRSAAARLLGISRRALYRRLDSFGLR